MVSTGDPSAEHLNVTDGSGFAANVMLLSEQTSPRPILEAVGLRMRALHQLNVIYGVKGDRALLFVAQGQPEALKRAFNLISASIDLDLVGDNMGGPNPAKLPADASSSPTRLIPATP